jgi:hypothetical protein
MFIYLEGKYNSLKGNLIILGTIMVIDAHLKNVNNVNNMKKYTVAKSKHPTHKYMAAHFRFRHEKGWF